MRISALFPVLFCAAVLPVSSPAFSAGEEIQLAAAIGARAIQRPVEEAASRRPEPAEAASSLSQTAMISMGVGVAVVVGVVAGGSSSSTTSH